MEQSIVTAAQALGFSRAAAQRARGLFRLMTEESLREPSPWPSPQLSSLSGGVPLEFSVTTAPSATPALRFTADVGDPYLAAPQRAASGAAAMSRIAQALGCTAAWDRVRPVMDMWQESGPFEDGVRFLVWGGMDIRSGPREFSPRLKVYLSLIDQESPGRTRLDALLAAASIPMTQELRTALETLDQHGFAQEIGFGMDPRGGLACKVYYELPCWDSARALNTLRTVGLPGNLDSIRPEIPGIVRESLAAKSRSGIALRLDAGTGQVRELTVATAFPFPMIPPQQFQDRVCAWIEQRGESSAAYAKVHKSLLDRAGNGNPPRHTLFTLTLNSTAAWATIYMRPTLTQPQNGPHAPAEYQRA